jgi:hypothetical protein
VNKQRSFQAAAQTHKNSRVNTNAELLSRKLNSIKTPGGGMDREARQENHSLKGNEKTILTVVDTQ